MKKLFSMGIFLSLLLALFTGCQNSGPEQDLGDGYVMGSDNQYYFMMASLMGDVMTDSEKALYFQNGYYLYAFDKKTKACVPLCNKPDCTHDEQERNPDGSSNCNACFMAEDFGYYQGKLYAVDYESIVWEISINGDTRKQLIQLEKEITSAIVHRGYLYLSTTDFLMDSESYTEEQLKNMSYEVLRYRLDQWDGKPEVVYEKTGEWGQINAMLAYGNYVYIQISGENDSRELIYNILDHSQKEMTNVSGYLSFLGGKLLYFPRSEEQKDDMTIEEISEIDARNMAVLAEWDGTVIKETEIPQTYGWLFGGEKLAAADNHVEVAFDQVPKEDRAVRFYDTDGKLIREVKTENDTMPMLGMTEDYFFYMKRGDGDNGDYEIWAIDLHKLDDPDLKGEPFFVPEE